MEPSENSWLDMELLDVRVTFENCSALLSDSYDTSVGTCLMPVE